MYRRQYMKQTIETQLDCKATASFQDEILEDMNKQDGSLASLLQKDNSNEDNDDQANSSD